jgi:hypothetical protein
VNIVPLWFWSKMSLTFELRLILAVLSCYRLARLIARDDGPFFLFKRVRYWAKDKAWWEAKNAGMVTNNQMSDRHYGKWHTLAEALDCPYCAGVWVSIPLFLFVIYPTQPTDLFMLLMAISGGQAWLWGMVDKK